MGNWGDVHQVLTAVTVSSTVTSPAVDLGAVYNVEAMQVTVTGFSGSGSLDPQLWGSLDGANFYYICHTAPGISANGTYMANSANYSGTAPYAPVRYLQAVMVPNSVSATVSAWVVGGTD